MLNFLAQMSDGVSISVSAGTAAIVTGGIVKWLTRKNCDGIRKALDEHQDRCIELVIRPRLKSIDDKLDMLAEQKKKQ